MCIKIVITRVTTEHIKVIKLNKSLYVTIAPASFLSSGGWRNAPTVPWVNISYCHGPGDSYIVSARTQHAGRVSVYFSDRPAYVYYTIIFSHGWAIGVFCASHEGV